MVGHFLHPNRKSRSSAGIGTSSHSVSGHSLGSGTGGQGEASSRSAPHFDGPHAGLEASLPIFSPRNLSAEAVAALPPPGMLENSMVTVVERTSL
jgi:hypothetical protein